MRITGHTRIPKLSYENSRNSRMAQMERPAVLNQIGVYREVTNNLSPEVKLKQDKCITEMNKKVNRLRQETQKEVELPGHWVQSEVRDESVTELLKVIGNA